MNIGKRKMVFLVLCGLFTIPAISCSTVGDSAGRVGGAGSSQRVVVSDLVTVELGKVLTFDAGASIVSLFGIANPGRPAEIGKRYGITILWKGQRVGDGTAQFWSLKTVTFASRSELDPREVRQVQITLQGELARQYIDLLAQSPEHKRLRKELDKLQEEKGKLQERQNEMQYNLFWKGEAPSYDEAKKATAQVKDVDAREKQLNQAIRDFPFSGVLPTSFVNSLEVVVEAKATPTPVPISPPYPKR